VISFARFSPYFKDTTFLCPREFASVLWAAVILLVSLLYGYKPYANGHVFLEMVFLSTMQGAESCDWESYEPAVPRNMANGEYEKSERHIG